MDFISSNSERLTAVPKFHKLFYLFFLKTLYKVSICFDTIPFNHRPKNDMVISSIKEVIK